MMRPVPLSSAPARFVGGMPPYGWRSDHGRLVEDPQEQAVRWLVLHLRAEGWSFRRIAGELLRLRIPSRTAAGWSLAALHRITANVAQEVPG